MDPEEIVRKAEAAYTAQDVERIMELFDPEIVIYWDGRKVAEGLSEARTFHEEMYADERQEYEVRKSLRAATEDTITVEWTVDWIDSDGNPLEGYGGEFWTMRDGRLREWHAYSETYEHDETDDQRDEEYLSHPQNPPTTKREPMDPEEIVRKAEAAYDQQDMERKMELFDPAAVVYWNGQKVAEGLEEVRQFHEEGDETEELEVRKTLRAASGDTIAVEWKATGIDSDRNRLEQYGGEFWTMQDGRLREWHAYDEVYKHDETEDRKDEEYLSHH